MNSNIERPKIAQAQIIGLYNLQILLNLLERRNQVISAYRNEYDVHQRDSYAFQYDELSEQIKKYLGV